MILALQTQRYTGCTYKNRQAFTAIRQQNDTFEGKKHLNVLYFMPNLQEGTNDLRFTQPSHIPGCLDHGRRYNSVIILCLV